MAERMNQKLKILYLMKILLEKTDETHSITVQEMITALASYGITAERKSLYSDLESCLLYTSEFLILACTIYILAPMAVTISLHS